jgi:hypothetical protein
LPPFSHWPQIYFIDFAGVVLLPLKRTT